MQVQIAAEQTKFGFEAGEILNIEPEEYKNINICGLMGMATNTEDNEMVISDFKKLRTLYETIKSGSRKSNQNTSVFNTLSMGMSDDYGLAINCGSNMVRVGSMIFGRR